MKISKDVVATSEGIKIGDFVFSQSDELVYSMVRNNTSRDLIAEVGKSLDVRVNRDGFPYVVIKNRIKRFERFVLYIPDSNATLTELLFKFAYKRWKYLLVCRWDGKNGLASYWKKRDKRFDFYICAHEFNSYRYFHKKVRRNVSDEECIRAYMNELKNVC